MKDLMSQMRFVVKMTEVRDVVRTWIVISD